ncbi:hypothetical protein E2562_036461 [Oryza meyeriana var. granulata]|uniref:Uncharacterized protein n=1 Tax=Oryza meyeriana var. granulata TaxID=110450 RepID=A0A6G1ETA2_9ORYZ|nr:hypothetical protein E2562_036461 [Oryza meyeriana var. granulata]
MGRLSGRRWNGSGTARRVAAVAAREREGESRAQAVVVGVWLQQGARGDRGIYGGWRGVRIGGGARLGAGPDGGDGGVGQQSEAERGSARGSSVPTR